MLRRLRRTSDRRAVVVLGPRQVGKTVLLRQLADDLLDDGWPADRLLYFDFSDDRLVGPTSPRDVTEHPTTHREADGVPRILLLDEIASSARWDLWLKQAVDRGVDRIVVTDSSASLLRDGTRESGQGRWDELTLEGLTFPEFVTLRGGSSKDFDAATFDRYLQIGGFPEHARSDDRAAREIHERIRSDLVGRAILRDLVATGIDVLQAKNLFVCLVQEAGTPFVLQTYSALLQADPRAVGGWLERLVDTKLLATLPRFATKARSRAGGRPRIYPSDHGLVPAFAASAGDAKVRERVFETVVYRHLRTVADVELSYFRLNERWEVDFSVQTLDGRRIAVEVTSSPDVAAEKRRKAEDARRRLGASKLLLVHGGARDTDHGTTRILPAPRFLLDVEAALFEEGGP